MNNSWLSPKGEIHDIHTSGKPAHSHYDWIVANTEHPSIESAFEEGWHRIYNIGNELYAHNSVKKLTSKQRKELKDHAIMNKKNEIFHSDDVYDNSVWRADNYSRHYANALRYSQVRPHSELNAMLRATRQNVHDMTSHGILADYLDDYYPHMSPFTELIRKHAGHNPNEKLENKHWPFADDNKDEGSLSVLGSRYLGHIGPFAVDVSFPMDGPHSVVHLFANGAHTDSNKEDEPLEYHFEMKTPKDADDFIDKLNQHPETKRISQNYLNHMYGFDQTNE